MELDDLPKEKLKELVFEETMLFHRNQNTAWIAISLERMRLLWQKHSRCAITRLFSVICVFRSPSFCRRIRHHDHFGVSYTTSFKDRHSICFICCCLFFKSLSSFNSYRHLNIINYEWTILSCNLFEFQLRITLSNFNFTSASLEINWERACRLLLYFAMTEHSTKLIMWRKFAEKMRSVLLRVSPKMF